MLAATAGSCAYYNTFYQARKYYDRATNGMPYEVGRANSTQTQSYAKAIDYSKKLLANYPKSKWVDDAYLMWAKSLIGRDDPLQTITMLQSFPADFPRSDLKPEAEFYLGLASRNARRYQQSIAAFDEFLTTAPKHQLVPYAHYERSLALASMKRWAESADAAGQILDHYPKHFLADRALRQRAEARQQQGDYDGARADFHVIASFAANDEERFQLLMREVDCLESARRYDEQLALLHNELSHTPPPPPMVPGQLPPAGSDHYGRLRLRVGTAHLLAGRDKEALDEYQGVIQDYPKTALSAEAQYRIAFTFETGGDDFPRALEEYGKVKEQFGQTPFTQQAQQRSDNLARIMKYRSGGGADSLEKKGEAAFLTAELYLFQLNKPERALEEYGRFAQDHPGTAVAGKALNAQGWVLSRKLDRKAEADSLFWIVVRDYPATEAQLAARDYLEMDGHEVPEQLIQMPATHDTTLAAPDSVHAAPDSTKSGPALAAPPAHVPPIGTGAFAPPDSSLRRMHPEDPTAPRGMFPPGTPHDSTAHPVPGAQHDSTSHPLPAPPPAPAPTPPPGVAPHDTTGGKGRP